jgi:hypothetical protein
MIAMREPVQTESVLPDAEAEDDDECAVGGCDRQQVEDHSLQRQEDRAEGAHQQELREREHTEHEPRERAVGAVEKVDPCGGPPPARTATPAGKPAAGISLLRSRRAKPCASSEPYSYRVATITPTASSSTRSPRTDGGDCGIPAVAPGVSCRCVVS